MAELVVTHADGRVATYPLRDRPVVIGRDAVCDVSIDDASASRRHVRFSRGRSGYRVEDLGSKNGTLINNVPCTKQALRDGDRLLIGSTLVEYHEVPRARDPASKEGRKESGRPSTMSVTIAEDDGAARATKYVSRDQQLLIPQQRLKLLYELSEHLTTLQGRDELLARAMQICCETLHFERGAIGVRRPGQQALDWPVVHNLRGVEGELRISRTLLRRALEHGERAIFTEDEAGSADPTVSMVQQGIRCAMCVPLLHSAGILGVIYGDRISTTATYTDEDIDFLAGIARQVSIGLINARLLEEQREMVRLNQEIDLARTIQTGLFPARLPDRPELKAAAINDPGQRVSGDYYDVIETADGRTWCLMADVTGEGVASALLMANLQAAVRVTVHDSDDPSELLERWNALIWTNTESSKFITCALALIDPRRRRIQVSLAGHCPPWLLAGIGTPPQELSIEPGFPLGVVPDAGYETRTIELGEGPIVYFSYTDGVTEAINGRREQFGMDRLRAALLEVADLNPQPLVKHVRWAVSAFAEGARQSDDITILAARVM